LAGAGLRVGEMTAIGHRLRTSGINNAQYSLFVLNTFLIHV